MRGMKVLKFLLNTIVYGSRGDIADLSSNYDMAYYILQAAVKMYIMLCSAYLLQMPWQPQSKGKVKYYNHFVSTTTTLSWQYVT